MAGFSSGSRSPWYKRRMPTYRVQTPSRSYSAIVERGIIGRAADHLPARGKVFVVTSEDVWDHQGPALEQGLAGRPHQVVYLAGGEEHKRLAPIETLAEEMVRLGADRSSVILGFGGGVVNDMAGFLAAIFMRGIAVIQIPTTLLAQVDAAVGGKTGVNLVAGKNLVGSFHQPLGVLIDPALLETLPEREYRAGLWEIVKSGIIRDSDLFWFLDKHRTEVLARRADAVEAETGYRRFLHGEAVAWGMRAAIFLGERTGHASAEECVKMIETIRHYSPIPALEGIRAE